MSAPIYTTEGASLVTDEDEQPIPHVKRFALIDRTLTKRESFEVERPVDMDHFTLGGYPAPGAELEIEDPTSIVEVVGYAEDTKIITLNSSAASEGDWFTVAYPVHPCRPADVVADVEIVVDDSWQNFGQDSWIPLRFEVQFSPRSTFWIYYLVTDNDRVVDHLKIEVPNGLSGFPPARRTELASSADSSDEIALWLASQYPDPNLLRVRFVSASPIVCRQASWKGIRLVDETTPLFSSLPNPQLCNLAINPLGGEEARAGDSLFHVVTYLTHSFPNSGE